jgi:mannosyltransferase OCH1-like enzyme
MVPVVVQYAASNGVWKNYPWSVPSKTGHKAVYLAIEKIIEQRPQFLFRVIWHHNSN